MLDINQVPEKELYYQSLEIDTLARTIWGEAGEHGRKEMEALACLILNRVQVSKAKGSYWWGNNIIQVCQKPYQFSCWNRSSYKFRDLLNTDETTPGYITAVRIAKKAVQGNLQDTVKTATHCHKVGESPYWAKDESPVAVVGQFLFYRFI